MTGFRLQPGTVIDETRLLSAIGKSDAEPARLATLVETHCHLDPAMEDAIAGLSRGARSVGQAARLLGVGGRALQRLFRASGQMPPEYWLLLARARRAAHLLRSPGSLADIALEAGYSDQAHMTRDFKRWFAVTPGRLRGNPAVGDQLRQSGLGTPVTGEHISIR
ncbi:MAG: helix-turn-helix domain-containing protein [Inquilinaceae bacterium]